MLESRAELLRRLGERWPGILGEVGIDSATVQPSGKDGFFISKCPWHEDAAPSLSIARTSLSFFCRAGCVGTETKWLSIFDAWNKDHGGDFRAAVIALKRAAGIEEEKREGLTLQAYAEGKALDVETLKANGIRQDVWDDMPALAIPYMDQNGQEIGLRYRLRLNGSDEKGRFKWKRGGKVILYGLWRLHEAREKGYLCLVEGESDTQSLWQIGEPALGVPGATNWREARDAKLLDGIPLIYVVIEPDDGGEAVLRWLSKSAIRERCRLIKMGKTAKDPNELLKQQGYDFASHWDTLKKASQPWMDPHGTAFEDRLFEFLEPGDLLASVPEEPGFAVMEDVRRYFNEFMYFPRAWYDVALSMWAMLAHCAESFYTSPRLFIYSAAPQSGKSRILDLQLQICPRALRTENPTEAVLFREIQRRRPTILLDEVDCIFGDEAKDKEGIRSILNDGYRKDGVVGRIEGEKHEAKYYNTFGPVAVSGIGHLKRLTTLKDRSIMLAMQRKPAGKKVRSFLPGDLLAETTALRRRMAAWCLRNKPLLDAIRVPAPDWLENRDWEIWGPMFGLAEVLGGDWPGLTHQAAAYFVGARTTWDRSGAEMLISDVLAVMAPVPENGSLLTPAKTMAAQAVVDGLLALDSATIDWSKYNRGRDPITQHQMNEVLRGLNVDPKYAKTDDGRKALHLDLMEVVEAAKSYVPKERWEWLSPPEYMLYKEGVVKGGSVSPCDYLPHPATPPTDQRSYDEKTKNPPSNDFHPPTPGAFGTPPEPTDPKDPDAPPF